MVAGSSKTLIQSHGDTCVPVAANTTWQVRWVGRSLDLMICSFDRSSVAALSVGLGSRLPANTAQGLFAAVRSPLFVRPQRLFTTPVTNYREGPGTVFALREQNSPFLPSGNSRFAECRTADFILVAEVILTEDSLRRDRG